MKAEDVQMPFGKHKGKALGQVLIDDATYLDWLSETLEPGRLLEAVAEMNQKYAAEIERAIDERRS